MPSICIFPFPTTTGLEKSFAKSKNYTNRNFHSILVDYEFPTFHEC